jgi:hypothetical protein
MTVLSPWSGGREEAKCLVWMSIPCDVDAFQFWLWVAPLAIFADIIVLALHSLSATIHWQSKLYTSIASTESHVL